MPHGVLSELPFSVRATSPDQPDKTGIPFSDHRGAPWLLKNAAISYLPLLSALGEPRRGDGHSSVANSFIGFGVPGFGGGTKSAASASRRARHGAAQCQSPCGAEFADE